MTVEGPNTRAGRKGQPCEIATSLGIVPTADVWAAGSPGSIPHRSGRALPVGPP
jgi:hypothetical protein